MPFEWGVFTGFTGLDMIYMMIMDTRNRLSCKATSTFRLPFRSTPVEPERTLNKSSRALKRESAFHSGHRIWFPQDNCCCTLYKTPPPVSVLSTRRPSTFHGQHHTTDRAETHPGAPGFVDFAFRREHASRSVDHASVGKRNCRSTGQRERLV